MLQLGGARISREDGTLIRMGEVVFVSVVVLVDVLHDDVVLLQSEQVGDRMRILAQTDVAHASPQTDGLLGSLMGRDL